MQSACVMSSGLGPPYLGDAKAEHSANQLPSYDSLTSLAN